MTVNSEPHLRHASAPRSRKEDVGDISYRNLSRSKRDDWQEGCLRGGEHSSPHQQNLECDKAEVSNCVHVKVLSLYPLKHQPFPTLPWDDAL